METALWILPAFLAVNESLLQLWLWCILFCHPLCTLKFGSRREAMASRPSVAESEHFSFKYWRMALFMSFVRSVSSWAWVRTVLLKRWSTGLRYYTLTNSSPDSASVNSVRGLRVLLTDSKKHSNTCHVGASCRVFLSALRTWNMAFSCSITLWIIFCRNPHLVGISVMR